LRSCPIAADIGLQFFLQLGALRCCSRRLRVPAALLDGVGRSAAACCAGAPGSTFGPAPMPAVLRQKPADSKEIESRKREQRPTRLTVSGTIECPAVAASDLFNALAVVTGLRRGDRVAG